MPRQFLRFPGYRSFVYFFVGKCSAVSSSSEGLLQHSGACVFLGRGACELFCIQYLLVGKIRRGKVGGGITRTINLWKISRFNEWFFLRLQEREPVWPSERRGGVFAWAGGIPRQERGLDEKHELMTRGRGREIKAPFPIGPRISRKEVEKESSIRERRRTNANDWKGTLVGLDFYFRRAC